MSDAQRDFSKLGFAKTYVLPAVLVFLIPIVSLFFFLHAQGRFNAGARESILAQLEADPSMPADRKAAEVAFFKAHPMSELLTRTSIGEGLDATTRFHYATFRWMIRLAVLSIVGGVAVFALAGVCVLVSRRSQRAQYLSLSVGWQVLRIYSAIQTVVQGAMVLALSFWVTALWFNVYSVKLIGVAALLALGGAAAVLKAIFTRPRTGLEVEGRVLDQASSPRLWEELDAICARVGTARPDQVIAGIDDNFFVTEAPVTVDGATCGGRTLYVSLALLKQMRGAEADAVLAHEMAHFSGADTLYSKKTAPLLARYAAYLQALYENPIARPVFYLMHCFRALFELSRGEQSRGREFRADRIAAEATSPRDLAGALLRISAYADFRGKVQQELFDKECVLEAANISGRLEQGFHQHALAFVARPDLGEIETAHPFDSHPPMAQRLEAVGAPIGSQDAEALATAPADRRWYDAVDDAEAIERGQWERFEERFRAFHEEMLPYRLLPATDEERAIVVKAFPAVAIEGKKGTLELDCDGMSYTAWPGRVAYSEITGLSLNDDVLRVDYDRDGKQKAKIPMKTFAARQQEALQAVNRYYVRAASAAAHHKEAAARPAEE